MTRWGDITTCAREERAALARILAEQKGDAL